MNYVFTEESWTEKIIDMELLRGKEKQNRLERLNAGRSCTWDVICGTKADMTFFNVSYMEK